MCTDHHDGTCTAVLSRSKKQAGHLTMTVVCEACSEVVRVLGSVEHTFEPLLEVASPEAEPPTS
jgi:hypothetical protein